MISLQRTSLVSDTWSGHQKYSFWVLKTENGYRKSSDFVTGNKTWSIPWCYFLLLSGAIVWHFFFFVQLNWSQIFSIYQKTAIKHVCSLKPHGICKVRKMYVIAIISITSKCCLSFSLLTKVPGTWWSDSSGSSPESKVIAKWFKTSGLLLSPENNMSDRRNYEAVQSFRIRY